MKAWILGIVAVSIISTAAGFITENTKGQKFVRVITSVLLLLAVVKPVLLNNKSFYDTDLFSCNINLDEAVNEADSWFASALENELSEKVALQAERFGIICKAKVCCTEKDNSIVPVSCEIDTEYNTELSKWIYENLGVSDVKWKIN